MTCDPSLVACQLARLADGAGAWDWNSFFSTAIATVIGGGIGLLGVWWTLHAQRKHRSREMLDDSVARVLQEIAAYATAGRRKLGQEEAILLYEKAGVDFFGRTGEVPVEEPSPLALSIAFDVAQMRARGEDQEVVTAAIRAHDAALNADSLRRSLEIHALVSGALSRWRSEIWSRSEVMDSLGRAAQLPSSGEPT